MQIKPNDAGVVVAIALLVGLTSACSPPKTPEEQVKERVEARYASMMKQDSKALYEFLPPAKKSSMSYENYLSSHPRNIQIDSYSVLKVECPSEDMCQVETQLRYHFAKGFKGGVDGIIDPVVPEKWIRADGRWWYYQDR